MYTTHCSINLEVDGKWMHCALQFFMNSLSFILQNKLIIFCKITQQILPAAHYIPALLRKTVCWVSIYEWCIKINQSINQWNAQWFLLAVSRVDKPVDSQCLKAINFLTFSDMFFKLEDQEDALHSTKKPTQLRIANHYTQILFASGNVTVTMKC
jgi:hypothetical protein